MFLGKYRSEDLDDRVPDNQGYTVFRDYNKVCMKKVLNVSDYGCI